jgi:hypothetical protein
VCEFANPAARPRSFVDLAGHEMAQLAVDIRAALDEAHSA